MGRDDTVIQHKISQNKSNSHVNKNANQQLFSKMEETMPRCHLTQKFCASLLKERPEKKLVHYYDTDLPGFMLEHRNTGSGTWYYRYPREGKFTFLRLGAMQILPVLEARAMAYELFRQVQEKGAPLQKLPELSKVATFSRFSKEYYLPHAKVKKRSWKTDERMLELHVLPAFGMKRLDKIGQIDVIKWQKVLREGGLAPCTCNRVLSLLKFVFNCAVRWGMLDAAGNPCRFITPFPDNSARERFLTVEEARRLIAKLDTMPANLCALALKLLLFTGARKSEILSARWENINLEQRILTVPLSKSGKSRHIPLSDEAIVILTKLSRCKATPWLFPAKKDGHLIELYPFWNALRQTLGLTDVRIHDLRHSFASFLVNSGCSLYEVQKILGHYDPKVTMRYAHLAHASLIQAANMVGKSVGV